MSEEVEVVAEVPAPEQVATAAPEPEDQTPEVAEEAPSEKLFTQEVCTSKKPEQAIQVGLLNK